jgi:hypothetical protein
MSPSDALPSEMPGFPFPGRPGGEHDEPLLDMILGRRALPPDAPPEIHDLARMLAALSGPAEPGELAAEADVRSAFTRLGPMSRSGRSPVPAALSHQVRRPTRHRRPRRFRGSVRRAARPRARLATGLVAALAGLVIIATYAGDLPGPVQRLAHATVAAPAPPSGGGTEGTDTLNKQQDRDRPAHPHPTVTPDPHSTRTHGAATSAAGSTPRPHYSPERSPSRGNHRPPIQACTPEPWWHDQSKSPGPGYHGPLPKAQPQRCPTPDPRPSNPPLGSYKH